MIIRLLSILLVLLSGILSGQSFVQMNEELNIQSSALDPKLMAGGVMWFDYNNDHYPDLLFTNGSLPVKLYRNDWNGGFTDVTQRSGLSGVIGTMGAVSADFDGDGYADIFLTTLPGNPNYLFRNNGEGRFTNISELAGITHPAYSASATVGDPDGDGDPDIYVANYLAGEEPMEGGQPNFFYRNDGSGKFEEVAAELGIDDSGCGLGATFIDMNTDGREDLYVANDFGYLIQPNEFFRNEGGAFHPEAFSNGSAATINAMGIAKGDYDNDGDQDLYITNIRENPLFENVNNGDFFRFVSIQSGVALPEWTSWGTSLADFNLDGFLDIIVVNGQIAEVNNVAEPMAFFKNAGDGTFRSLSEIQEVSVLGRGLAVADYDLDGLQDVAVNAVNENETGLERAGVLRNTSTTDGHWLAVHSPFSAVRMELYAGGQGLYREKDGGSSYLSHSSGPIHFGAEGDAEIDSLIISYRDGSRVNYQGLSWDKLVGIRTDGSWYTIGHNLQTTCAEQASDPDIQRVWATDDEELETLMIERNETIAYTVEPVRIVEINKGEAYRGVARTQDAVIVDTIASASGCPVLQPVEIRILPELRQRAVYPNPAREELIVSLPEGGGALTLELITITGSLVYSQPVMMEERQRVHSFLLPNLPTGGYFCRLIHQGQTTNHKLIIR